MNFIEFRSLSLGSNPITAIHNNTFGGILDKLDHLDISSLHLNILEVNFKWINILCEIFFKISYDFRMVHWVNQRHCVHYNCPPIQAFPNSIFQKSYHNCRICKKFKLARLNHKKSFLVQRFLIRMLWPRICEKKWMVNCHWNYVK